MTACWALRIVEDGLVRFVPVRMNPRHRDGVWLSGLPEVADVITVGQEFVTDGVPVRVTYEELTQMTGVIDWAASRARMIVAFVILSLTSGDRGLYRPAERGRAGYRHSGPLRVGPFPRQSRPRTASAC